MPNEDNIARRISRIANLEELQRLYGDTFGKSGVMTARLKSMRDLPDAERALLNKEKEDLQAAFKERRAALEYESMMAELAVEKIDATRSPPPESGGRLHPLTRAFLEISAAWRALGYEFAEGPEIEDDWHNFTALNVAPHHPARDMQDTFFIEGSENVMRTQTTSVQVREMTRRGAPLKMFAAGSVYRREMDATHSAMFNQVDWFAADRDLTLADLVSDIKSVFAMFFETGEVDLRLRPSYFPFTEPSLEFDMRWDRASGRPSADGEWLEMGGAGMIHPNVFKNCGVDADKFRGFAGAFGVDRMAMLKYGLSDVRKFTDGDVRWLLAKGF